MGCPQKYQFGRHSLLEVAIQCQDEDPATTTFKPLGAVTTKALSMDGNVIEINDSSSASGFTENQLATSSISLSISGNKVRDETSLPNATLVAELMRFRFNSVNQSISEDPVILVRLTGPDNTLTAYMVLTSISDDMPDADLSTYSMELVLATSPTYPPTLAATVVV